ncbi:nephrocystin-4 [Porphyrio hochstetteri]
MSAGPRPPERPLRGGSRLAGDRKGRPDPALPARSGVRGGRPGTGGLSGARLSPHHRFGQRPEGARTAAGKRSQRREEEQGAGTGLRAASSAPSIPLRSRGAPPRPRLRRPPPDTARWRREDAADDRSRPSAGRGAGCPPPPVPPAAPGLRAGGCRGAGPGTGGGVALPQLRPRPFPAPSPPPRPPPSSPPRPSPPRPPARPRAPRTCRVRRSQRPAAAPSWGAGPAPPRPAPAAADWPRRPPLRPHANDGGPAPAPLAAARSGPAARPRPSRCGTIALVTRCWAGRDHSRAGGERPSPPPPLPRHRRVAHRTGISCRRFSLFPLAERRGRAGGGGGRWRRGAVSAGGPVRLAVRGGLRERRAAQGLRELRSFGGSGRCMGWEARGATGLRGLWGCELCGSSLACSSRSRCGGRGWALGARTGRAPGAPGAASHPAAPLCPPLAAPPGGGSEWERAFLQSPALPPHHRRAARPAGSTAFRCCLGALEGAALAQGAEYQLRLSLFDATYHHFFGRTWRSARRAARAAPPRTTRVAFNESVYFHTSLNHPGIAAVVEVVVTASKGDGGSRHLSCGFGLIPLFSSGSETMDSAPEDRTLKLYHGTPRALLHPRFQDPVEKNKYLTVMERSHLQYTLKPHQPLEMIFHLLPENLLVSGLQNVPGLLPAHGATGDCLQKPRPMKPVTCYLERLSVRLYPSLEEFEEELLDLLNSDRLLKANAVPDGDGVAVRERRLHVGVHNGLRFVQVPQVAVLVLEAEAAQGSCQRVPGSRGRGEGQALVLRSRIHLSEMVPHAAFGVCFQLEYVFCASGRAGGKALPGSARAEAADMCSVRWAVWSPVLGAGEAEVVLPLRGGAHRSPCQALVYRSVPSGRSSRRGKHGESGTVQFRVSTDSEEHLVTAVESLRKARDEPERPPAPALSSSVPPQMEASPRGPGLSVSQLSALPRGREQPPVPHGRSSQQEGGITHLEADLGSPDPEPHTGDQLRALPFAPLQVPMAALGLQAGRSHTLLSRASLARLRAAGFPDILDHNQEPVEVSEPGRPVSFSPQLEEADPLQGNEIILQFLAFGRDARDSVEGTWPGTVFLTFQFYRFPPVTTPRLQLVSMDGGAAAVPVQLLVRVNKDGTLSTGPPGFQLKYLVDPAFLRRGEQCWFLRYLAEHSLQIDVWDGDSLLLVGSAAVKLEPLLRQGRAAVRTHHELEVATTEYEPDVTVMGREALRHGALRPLGVHVAVRGRLHLCLANVGHPCEETPGRLPSSPPPRSRLVPAADGAGSVLAGSWLSLNLAGGRHVSRARRLAEVDSALADVLRSRRLEARLPPPAVPSEAAAARRRKLRRMALVRQQEDAGGERTPQVSGWQEQRSRHLRDLQIIDAYREHMKGESISRMLSQAITSTHTVHAVLGTAEFFEFALKNPYSIRHTVTIEVDHPELSVILDPREWRHFKALTKSATPVEEEMFHVRDDLRPQVYLRPKETIRIPFKYQTFSSDPAVTTVQGPAGLEAGADVATPLLGESGAGGTKHIQVSFRLSGGKPIALLRVKVEPQPHVVDQTFRFYHPELTFLKKSIRLPPWHTLPGAPVGMPGGEPEMFVRCSDPNIICETKNMGPGEPQDIFLKVAGGPSPQIKKFFVAIYMDAWLAAPVQIWQFYLHSLQRLDVSCTAGQLSRLSLLLRGTPAPRRVRVFTSHPQELEVDPSGAFLLPANGIQDLYVGVRPRRAGSRFIYLNLVDVESHQLVSSWLLCLACRQPLISKAFEISLPTGGGRGCNKRITYTNPYPSPRLYFLRTNRPDLLQFREDSFQVAGGEVYTIGLRFAPSQGEGEEEILIHINDHEDKNEETFCVKVLYQ